MCCTSHGQGCSQHSSLAAPLRSPVEVQDKWWVGKLASGFHLQVAAAEENYKAGVG